MYCHPQYHFDLLKGPVIERSRYWKVPLLKGPVIERSRYWKVPLHTYKNTHVRIHTYVLPSLASFWRIKSFRYKHINTCTCTYIHIYCRPGHCFDLSKTAVIHNAVINKKCHYNCCKHFHISKTAVINIHKHTYVQTRLWMHANIHTS